MRYIFYALLVISFLFGNEELDSYLNNKDLQYQIIKDGKNQRIIIDLLYEEDRMIIFSKDKNKIYQKTFDEKVYFCNKGIRSDPLIKLEKMKINIICSITNTKNGMPYREIYNFEDSLTPDAKLLSIEAQYININDDTISDDSIFKPQKDIPTLKDYTDENFSEKYLDENYKNFIKMEEIIGGPKNLQGLKFFRK